MVWRGPPGALGLRGRWGWNRTSVNTFSSHESEDLVWIFGFKRTKRSQSYHRKSLRRAFKARRPDLNVKEPAPCSVVFLFLVALWHYFDYSLVECFLVGTSQNFICRPENGFYFQGVSNYFLGDVGATAKSEGQVNITFLCGLRSNLIHISQMAWISDGVFLSQCHLVFSACRRCFKYFLKRQKWMWLKMSMWIYIFYYLCIYVGRELFTS